MRRGQQAEHVRADGKKGHKAQIKQTGVTDNNIQPQRQQDIKQSHVGDTHPAVAYGLQQQRQDQQDDSPQRVALVSDGLSVFHTVMPCPPRAHPTVLKDARSAR